MVQTLNKSLGKTTVENLQKDAASTKLPSLFFVYELLVFEVSLSWSFTWVIDPINCERATYSIVMTIFIAIST